MKYMIQTLIGGVVGTVITDAQGIENLVKEDNRAGFLDGLCIYDVSTFGNCKQVTLADVLPGSAYTELTGVSTLCDSDFYGEE